MSAIVSSVRVEMVRQTVSTDSSVCTRTGIKGRRSGIMG